MGSSDYLINGLTTDLFLEEFDLSLPNFLTFSILIALRSIFLINGFSSFYIFTDPNL